MRQIAVRNRVALTGFGADPALSCLLSVHFLHLLKKKQFGRALAGAMQYLRVQLGLQDGDIKRLTPLLSDIQNLAASASGQAHTGHHHSAAAGKSSPAPQ